LALSKKPINPNDIPMAEPISQRPATQPPVQRPQAPQQPPKAPFVPPKQHSDQAPFKPKERRILDINEGVSRPTSNLHDVPKIDTNVKPKRIRLTTGALTAQDILDKDYVTNYAHMSDKVVEVVEWTQNKLTDNDKNDQVSIARRERSDAFEEMSAFIDNLLVKYFSESGVVRPGDQAYVIQATINEILGLGPIEPLWQDPRISEIMVNGPGTVYVEIQGKIRRAPGAQFRDKEHLLQVCQQILGDIGRRVDMQKPLADGSLPDGSRINVVHYIVAPDGPYLTVRRFPDTIYSIQGLVEKNSMTEEMALEIGNLVHKGCSTIISGGTGSGKTSMLNALSGAIPETDRIITTEDTLELRLNPNKHVVRLVTKEAGASGDGGISIRNLVTNTLRMRPERVVVGEIRDASALDMMTAMTTGHEGSLTTVHANDANGAVKRIAQLIAQSGELDYERSLPLIAGAVDIIVSIARYEDGSRRISTISELPDHVKNDTLEPTILWEFVQDSTENGTVIGHYEKRNELSADIIRKHRLDKKPDLSLEELYELSSVPDVKKK
jgi:pilus assembly protein CpaF